MVKKLLLILFLLIVSVGICVYVFIYRGINVAYQGYLIRHFEALYFAPHTPVDGNGKWDKIWIDNISDEAKEQWRLLEWQSTNQNFKVEYVKALIRGKKYGPYGYGHLGQYRYEMDIESIK